MRKIQRRADAGKYEIARHLKDKIADEEHPGTESEYCRRKPQIPAHAERGKADIDSVEKIHCEKQNHKRNQPPRTFREYGIFVLHRLLSLRQLHRILCLPVDRSPRAITAAA